MPQERVSPQPRADGDLVEVVAPGYTWRWSRVTDECTLSDAAGRRILTSCLQPAFEVTDRAAHAAGRCAGADVDGSRLRVRYDGVNGSDKLAVTLRFASAYFVIEEAVYEPADDAAIVRFAYFADWDAGQMRPAGIVDTCVIPGGRQDPEQAIFRTEDLDDHRFSIGAFGLDVGTYHQQWALPHYLVAAYNGGDAAPSGAACVGLGGAADGNVLARVHRGRFSYEINVRGDLWGHRCGPGPIRFAESLVVAVAGNWYAAGLAYFDALDAEGFAPKRRAEDVPAAAYRAQYDTWGDQGARRCLIQRFDEQHLRDIYRDFRASKLNASLFVIDDKWEDTYGSLSHDEERFPNFVSLLDEIRADGHEIGIWTAFPRCEDYEALGLTADAVLRNPDGSPYLQVNRKRSWYVFDPTNASAAAYLADRARHLVETYRPSLVKIDFGYEIPTPDIAAPHDLAYAGERLFLRFLEVVVGAIRAADPNVAMLYYCLTPLFSGYMDQSGTDDLWMSRGRYDEGFARRALLSTWCGAFGVVPYGSSGYDWRSMREIWFDTAIVGTLGVIAPLAGDEYGEHLTPALAALYNGVARVTRRRPHYRVAFFDAELDDPAAGPRARSWARIEDGATVVLALRPGAEGVAEAPGIVRADCAVVVASLTDDDVRTSRAIGIVPFEAGRIAITRTAPGNPIAVAHLLSGEDVSLDVRRSGSQVVIDVAPSIGAAGPVELIEIRFA